MPIQKEQVIKGFLAKFKEEHSSLIQSAKAAHQAATHEESKAEDRHDTFAIEASYLAAGQATRVQELEKTILEFETYLSSTPAAHTILPGNFFSYELDGAVHFAFFANLGGGSKIQIDTKTIQILSLKSPLGEELHHSKVGDEITIEIRGQEKDYRIISIQ